jgi:hypothetical protein
MDQDAAKDQDGAMQAALSLDAQALSLDAQEQLALSLDAQAFT